MKHKNVEELFETHPPVDRQFVKDNLSFFKFQIRSPVDRRRVKDRRSPLKQEYLNPKHERRVNKVDRRTLGDRRGIFSRCYEYVVRKRALIFKRIPFA